MNGPDVSFEIGREQTGFIRQTNEAVRHFFGDSMSREQRRVDEMRLLGSWSKALKTPES